MCTKDLINSAVHATQSLMSFDKRVALTGLPRSCEATTHVFSTLQVVTMQNYSLA